MSGFSYQRWTPDSRIDAPLRLYHCAVDPNWIDYNGHMTESSYLWAFGEASDALFRYVGIDQAYRAAGRSFYTVETHINYYKEVRSGGALHFTTQLLGLDEKRLHLFHTMVHGVAGELLCTTEQMLIHVATRMGAASASPIPPEVYSALRAILAAHQALPIPKQVGRQMAIKKKEQPS
jgi:carnitine 3-dehydrogenase